MKSSVPSQDGAGSHNHLKMLKYLDQSHRIIVKVLIIARDETALTVDS